MKLTALHEASSSILELSEFTSGLSQQNIDGINALLAKFKGYKVTSSDVTDSDLFVHMSNGLVEFDFSFEKSDNNTIVIVEIAAMVNSKYVHGAEGIDSNVEGHKIALLNSFSRAFRIDRQERLNQFVDGALKVASAFEDWYFEISGSVGKIKLIKITTDLEDGSSNNVWKWTPYAGQFWVDGDHIEARS